MDMIMQKSLLNVDGGGGGGVSEKFGFVTIKFT